MGDLKNISIDNTMIPMEGCNFKRNLLLSFLNFSSKNFWRKEVEKVVDLAISYEELHGKSGGDSKVLTVSSERLVIASFRRIYQTATSINIFVNDFSVSQTLSRSTDHQRNAQ